MEYKGIVIKGNQEGRQFGFPTANIEVKNDLKAGVYSGYVEYDGGLYRSAIVVSPVRVGKIIEAFIINFNEDLYGKEITMRVEDYLRGWIDFKNPEEAKKRIEQDIKIIGERL